MNYISNRVNQLRIQNRLDEIIQSDSPRMTTAAIIAKSMIDSMPDTTDPKAVAEAVTIAVRLTLDEYAR